MVVEGAEQTLDSEPFEPVEGLLYENIPQGHGCVRKSMNAE